MNGFLNKIFRKPKKTVERTDTAIESLVAETEFAPVNEQNNDSYNYFLNNEPDRSDLRLNVVETNGGITNEEKDELGDKSAIPEPGGSGLLLTDPKIFTWKDKDAYVYKVSTDSPGSGGDRDLDLEFVIYIPIETAVHWLDVNDQGKRGKEGHDKDGRLLDGKVGRTQDDDGRLNVGKGGSSRVGGEDWAKGKYGSEDRKPGRKGEGKIDKGGYSKEKYHNEAENKGKKDGISSEDDSDDLKGEFADSDARKKGGKGDRSIDNDNGRLKGKSESGDRSKGNRSSDYDGDQLKGKSGARKRGSEVSNVDDEGRLSRLRGKSESGDRSKGNRSSDYDGDQSKGKSGARKKGGDSNTDDDEDHHQGKLDGGKGQKGKGGLSKGNKLDSNDSDRNRLSNKYGDINQKKKSPFDSADEDGNDRRSGLGKSKVTPDQGRGKDKTASSKGGEGEKDEDSVKKKKKKPGGKVKMEESDEDDDEDSTNKISRKGVELNLKRGDFEPTSTEFSFGPHEVYVKHPNNGHNATPKIQPYRIDIHHPVGRQTM